jgi:hypothetical protein
MGEEEIFCRRAFGHIISGAVKSVANSMPPQGITGVEMKIFSVLNGVHEQGICEELLVHDEWY